jgi:protein tyrosine phosphatase type 4A
VNFKKKFRAPVLIAIALIEIGMDTTSAIQLIRMKRKGALNMQQYMSLKNYKKSGFKGKNTPCCIIF